MHNLALPTTQLLGQVFKGADLDTQTNLTARRVCRDIPGGTLASCQDQLLRQCISQLYSYRKNCTTAPSSGQLILPEALKLSPFYSLGLSKSPCLRHVLTVSLQMSSPSHSIRPHCLTSHDPTVSLNMSSCVESGAL